MITRSPVKARSEFANESRPGPPSSSSASSTSAGPSSTLVVSPVPSSSVTSSPSASAGKLSGIITVSRSKKPSGGGTEAVSSRFQIAVPASNRPGARPARDGGVSLPCSAAGEQAAIAAPSAAIETIDRSVSFMKAPLGLAVFKGRRAVPACGISRLPGRRSPPTEIRTIAGPCHCQTRPAGRSPCRWRPGDDGSCR